VSAGHGARVGLAVVSDYRRTVEDWWDEAARYHDWVVDEGRYAGAEWAERMADYYAEHAPDDRDEETVRERALELAHMRQDRQIDETEVQRRSKRGYDRLLEFIPDEQIRAYVDELDTTEVAHGE
jgi:hypothetical protein